jgi:polyhydroxyalkanoate synthesis repressor PhaR
MKRIIKRYTNRKLYDTSESRYVTLEEIARYVRSDEDVTVIENETGKDMTALAFAQIILDEERREGGVLSLAVLRELIRHGEEALQGIVAQVDRGVGAIGAIGEQAGRRVQDFVAMGGRLGTLQRQIDDGLKRSFERIATHPIIPKGVQRTEGVIGTPEGPDDRQEERKEGQRSSSRGPDDRPPER